MIRKKYTIDERDIFIRGKNVYLKTLTPEDVYNSGWYGWFNDKNICETLQKHYYPNSVEAQSDFLNQLKNNSEKNEKLQLGICKKKINKLLGIISLSNFNYVNQSAEMSTLIGESEGKDLKTITEAWRLFLWHGFNVLNLNKIYSGSISKSLVELICRVAAASEEGVRKKHVYKNGKFVDIHLWGILKSNFNKKYYDL